MGLGGFLFELLQVSARLQWLTDSHSSILSCILFISNLLILVFNNMGTLKCVIKIDIIWITISVFITEWLYLIGL